MLATTPLKSGKRFVAAQEACVAYGSNLVDTSPGDQSSLGAWNRNLMPEHFLCTIVPTWMKREFSIRQGEEDPFTQNDLLERKDNQVQDLIFRVTSIALPYRDKLEKRLLSLFNAAKEEEPDAPGISLVSLRNFYDFLQLGPGIKYPTISLTRDNNIYASWRGDNGCVFSIHFLSTNKDARFVILMPNEKYQGRQIEIYGSATIDVIWKKFVQFDVLSLVIE